MFVVISYDIISNKRRSKLAKALLDYGHRVQKSVFECVIDEGNFMHLKQRIEKIINLELDSVRYYFICKRCEGNIEVSGWGSVTEDEDVLIS